MEELKGNREQIVITEIPYNVNRATLVERIAQLVNDKVLSDITAIRDESDENTRVVIELKRDGNPKVVINNLYKHTAMESSFAVTMLAIDHGRPKLLSLKEANAAYIEHRRDVVLRRTRFELRKAEERAETLEGYLIALANLDEFIRIIRGSANRDDNRAGWPRVCHRHEAERDRIRRVRFSDCALGQPRSSTRPVQFHSARDGHASWLDCR